MTTPLKKIVIVGGGAGGLELATRLGKRLGRYKKAKIVLVDHNHSHLWKPLLHKVAAGSIDENIDHLNYLVYAHSHHFNFQFGSIVGINRKSKTITLAPFHDEKGILLIPERKLKYNTLIMALGSVSNDFNIPGIKGNCISLDNPDQAYRFRREILNLFLKYSNNLDNTNSKINIAIIGAGATGVELSSELHNTVKQLNSYGYKKLTQESLNIILIEASERILPILPLRVSNLAYDKLTKLGIRILTQTTIISADEGGLYTKSGEYIKADLMVWVAGIKAPDFMKDLGGLETNHINQLIVETTLRTTRDQDIFAIGDCASCTDQRGGFVPPRAQAAHQMAKLVLYNIVAQMKNKPLRTYIYKDYGSLISLSNYSTIGSLMIKPICDLMIIKGRIARFIYVLLYRKYQIAIHGYFKTSLMILVDNINRFIRSQ